MLMMKAGVFRPRALVSLRKMGEALPHPAAPAGELNIGAMAPLSALEHSPSGDARAPVIVRPATLSNVRVRNVATVGGALAHARPAYGFAAGADRAWRHASRSSVPRRAKIAVEDLFTGYYETTLAKNELIAEVRVPAQGERRAVYFKVTSRSADDWPVARVAVALHTDGTDRQSARIVVSAATDKAARLQAAEAVLKGAGSDDRLSHTRRTRPSTRPTSSPMLRGSAAYKKRIAAGLCRTRSALQPQQAERRTDGHDDCRRTGRPLGAAAGSARQGDRPRRIRS